MRIGIPDLDQYNPRRGIGRTISTLAATWQRWGHEAIPLASRTSGLPLLRNLTWGLHGPLRELDVIFFGDLLGAESLFFLPRRIPTVVMVHDIGAVDCADDRAEASLLTRPRTRLALLGARRATRLVTDSDFTRQRLCRQLPGVTNRVTTVHLAVDHQLFRPSDRGQARASLRGKGIALEDEDLVAIYVGAEYRRKNLDGLVEAFALFKSKAPSARLLKVGAAHDRAARERTLGALRRHHLAIGRDVLFVEAADDHDLAELYCSADLFVTASKYEGFGLPLLEAMSCGLPCVVSNAGSLPEVGGDAALYVDPSDAPAFAVRLAEVAHGEHPGLRERALARAAQFSWATTAARTLQILKESNAAHTSRRRHDA